MRIGANYPEKKDVSSLVLYIKFALLGLILAAVLIIGAKTTMFLFGLLFKYWLWVIGLIACFVLIKRFFRRKK